MFFVLPWRLLLNLYLENLKLSYLDPLENELLERMEFEASLGDLSSGISKF